ncbi:hypothetical protein GWI33_003771 [Rhynchophorus ferrugineus]|uniref:DNA polymerase n=1 Tax=Rhynchophorus ferrugineus TaxID=354439 RepID=A0A834IJC9_RHYFE|nr:hypothetical protein GWI33_003771 [Rhynchophorus ferrugineus]
MVSTIRIVVIDYYLSTPIPELDVTYSEFRGTSINQVPVLRCFGSDENGNKICVHIHGVFPYLYIPYDGTSTVETFIYQLASSIDKAVNVSLNQASSSTQHVYKICLVSGIPMYGYHAKKHQFLKIFLYNPMLVTTVSNLLINKSILGHIYQPHEAHINYTLQFMIDYNLHGMSKMLISDIKYRGAHNNIDGNNLPPNIEKITVCKLEGDVDANCILNRKDIINGKLGTNPGIAALWEDEKQRLRNKNEDSQLGDFLELSNFNIEPTKTHFIFKEALCNRLAVLSSEEKTSKADLEVSVYPAETPSDIYLKDASVIDIHTPSSLELSLDDTLNKSTSMLNYTMTPENFNITVDEDAQVFLEVLEDLAEEKEQEELEQGSILSQEINEDQMDDTHEDDLSMSLASITNQCGILKDMDLYSYSDEDDNDLKNKNIIPQIDGQWDTSDDEFNSPQITISTFKQIYDYSKTYYESKTTGSKKRTNTEHITKSTLPNNKAIKNATATKITTLKYKSKKYAYITKYDSMVYNAINLNSLAGLKFLIHDKYTANSLHNIFKLPINSRNYLNCDGTADDSSSEDDLIMEESSKIKVSKYIPLNICVTESPKPLRKLNEEKTDQLFQGNQNISTPKKRLHAQLQSYRKRINFNPDFTTTDEYTACSYSPRHCVNEKFKYVVKTEANHSIPVAHQINNGDSEVFSQENVQKTFLGKHDLSKICLEEQDISVAAKYDLDTNYLAKEGCSFVCTPNSFTNLKSPTVNQQAPSMIEISNAEIHPLQNNPYDSPTTEDKKVAPSDKVISMMPMLKAPSISDIESYLSEKNISRIKCQEPFYSNINDYTGPIEIGYRTLRIASKCNVHLQEFETEHDVLNMCRKLFTFQNKLTLNSNSIKNIKLTQCCNRNVLLKPLKQPPSACELKKWLQDTKIQEYSSKCREVKFKKTKILMSNSSGCDGDEDSDVPISLTPCTPISPDEVISSSKFQKVQDVITETNKSCQISGVTQSNSFGFDNSVHDFQAARAVSEHQYLTTMVMELHVRTRGNFKPDPEYDAICAIFYSILNDVPDTQEKQPSAKGIIALNRLPLSWDQNNNHLLDGININCDIILADTEEDVISLFLNKVKYWDPDILTGYEIQMLSWGYLVDRGFTLSLNLIPLLGRSQINKYGKSKIKPSKYELESDITGRIVLDAWRLMRHEIALQSYTFESIVYHILHKRVPQFSFRTLSFWWDHKTNHFRHRVINYYLLRVDTILELFQKLDFINRTSELAKLFGIMFYEVLSRGSQFRVESMMLRLAKPLNYLPVSPNVNQRAHMKAPEFVPLIMEPESKLYNDPVIVLDFQSLYPSIIIAYNYCFTTCLGRVSSLGTDLPFEFGSTQLKVPRKLTEMLVKKDLLNFAPCGVAFVKKEVREGILPRMLKEILNTRLMVKSAMKQNKGNENLQKVLHNRQLGLKLIANVTFGYTAASFSGRMSCVEIMDSILSKARETLQRAIAMVETTSEWGGKVVYGDTDSLFVMIPGKTKEEAFEIGKKIADAITNDNPDPVKLKLEKIYQPCILQTKKRYVGYMYESPDQIDPIYEAKGIETVRRDGCPAVSKILRKCLTLLFDTKDMSIIKNYVLRQFHKIFTGRVSIQDLAFAKEYRGASGYKPGACVPALELAKKWRAIDRRDEPRSGERVPYVIIHGAPGLPLIRLVRSPRDLLNDSSLKPNSLYYITKVLIPPLNRCLSLLGADVNIWFSQMPRRVTQYLPNSSPTTKSTISQYFIAKLCACCSQPTQDGLCSKCYNKPANTTITLVEKLQQWERKYHDSKSLCQSCTGHQEEIDCLSLDCPVLYRRYQTHNDLQQAAYVRELFNSFFSDGILK